MSHCLRGYVGWWLADLHFFHTVTRYPENNFRVGVEYARASVRRRG